MSEKSEVITEFLARFTQTWNEKDLDALKAADDTKVEARGCDAYTFKNGKIMSENSMRKQLP